MTSTRDFFAEVAARSRTVAVAADPLASSSSSLLSTASAAAAAAASAAAAILDLQPWIEKYRPQSIAEIASQNHVIKVLRASIESQNLSHLVFYGPPGTGKTSTILALAKDIFGTEAYRSRVLELNASDERGIDVVRHKVKAFAQTLAQGGTNNGKRLPPYKIIVLDEADSMTPDAQAALRRTMERFSSNTRFCLICNYASRIIEPLASRCSVFRFGALDSSEAAARLSHIALRENVCLDNQALETLINVSEGDLRKAIMYLQSAARLFPDPLKPIPSASICEIAGVVPKPVIDSLALLWGAMPPATFDTVTDGVQQALLNGYSAGQLLKQLFERLLEDNRLSSTQKALMARSFGLCDIRLLNGADEFLQLADVILECCRISNARIGHSGN